MATQLNERARDTKTQRKEMQAVLDLSNKILSTQKESATAVIGLGKAYKDLTDSQKEFILRQKDLQKSDEEIAKNLITRQQNLEKYLTTAARSELIYDGVRDKIKDLEKEEIASIDRITEHQANGQKELVSEEEKNLLEIQAKKVASENALKDLAEGKIKSIAEFELQVAKDTEKEKAKIEQDQAKKQMQEERAKRQSELLADINASKARQDQYKKELAENEKALKNAKDEESREALERKNKELKDSIDAEKRVQRKDKVALAKEDAKAKSDAEEEEKKKSGKRHGTFKEELAAPASRVLSAGNGEITIGSGNLGTDLLDNALDVFGALVEELKPLNLLKNAINIFSAGFDALNDKIDNAAELIYSYQAKVSYRLEGVGKSFDDIYGQIRRSVGLSGAIRQEDMIKRVAEAVDQGIAYNVEQRAFLSMVSDNIQSTFDAFNSNLTRIIRIQQADSTIARLGMEKAVNDLLTNMYKDSSYMNDAYKTVSGNLFEMTSLMSREESVNTEYVIQKWLGSLYSLGASQNTISAISQGLGYLGSGNVQALSGNPALQALLAMSASRAGKDYATLLTSGLNAEDTNDLLKAMVEYLSEIADSTAENNVVTSAFGNVFGLTVSDIKSFHNLASSVNTLYSQNLNYTGAQSVTQNALSKYTGYLGTAGVIKNMWQNAQFDMAMQWADGPQYLLYKAVNMIDSLTNGGPEVKVQPWGLGASFKIFDIIKAAMFGAGLIGTLANAGASAIGGGPLNLANWGYEDTVTRGGGLNLKATNGTSFSQTVGSSSSGDITDQSLKEGSEQSEEFSNKSGMKPEHTAEDIYVGLFRENDKYQLSDVKIKVDHISDNIDKAMSIEQSLIDISSKVALNVNLSKINGKDVNQSNALPITPDEEWRKLLTAIAAFIKVGQTFPGIMGAINIQKEEEPEFTLQDLIDAFVPMLQGETGVPVKIESVDSITNLMSDLRGK